MTRDIGNMDTPPYGTPILPIDDRITPVEILAEELRRKTPRVPTITEDLIILGRQFAKPRNWERGELVYRFLPDSQNYLGIAGGIDMNNRFMVPLRHMAGAYTHLRDFHGIVGHLSASFAFLTRSHDLSRNFKFGIWHDVLLKAFFLEMLKSSYPTVGETLPKFWKYDMNRFTRTLSQLRSTSTHPFVDDYSRAAALSVYGYTAPFFAQCHDTFRQGAVDQLNHFKTHPSPIVANAAMLSLRTLSRIGL